MLLVNKNLKIKRKLDICGDIKYFLYVFPGQKAQITDCQARTLVTLTFTHEHTFICSLYKCLLITHSAPGARGSVTDAGEVATALWHLPSHSCAPWSLTLVSNHTFQHGPANVPTCSVHV